jgi:diguanylate cyclase (GGDEF)-like protein
MAQVSAKAARTAVQSNLRLAAPAVLVIVLMAMGTLLLAAESVNAQALRRETAIAERIAHDILRADQTQHDWAGIDDDMVVHAVVRPDPAWLRERLITSNRQDSTPGYVFVLSAEGRPLVAGVAGRTAPASAYEPFERALSALVEDVRRQERSLARGLGAAGAPARARGLISVSGAPFAANISTITPHTARLEAPVRSALLITMRALTPSYLRGVGQADQLGDLRLTFTPPPRTADGSALLATGPGERAAWLVWTRDMPGNRLLRMIAAVFIVSIALFVVSFWRAVTRANRAAAEIALSEARAEHAGLHDPLTGLANRTLMHDRQAEALAGAKGPVSAAALLMVDLDDFNGVNDLHGHDCGDAVLREVGARLAALAGPDDTVARLGGDEFQLLLTGAQSPAEFAAMARRVLKAIESPITVGGAQVQLSATVGFALAEDGLTPDELARRAALALIRAKIDSPGSWLRFDPQMDELTRQRRRLEADIAQAIESGSFALHYQPQMSSDGSRLTGVEALLRWRHPDLGMVSPSVFIPIAEETGMIRDLTLWTFERACLDARLWPDLSVAVNISPILFRSTDLPDALWSIVRAAEIDPRRIEIELTESVLLDDTGPVRVSLGRLRVLGFRIALDDFGTGYSSLSYLRRFTIDKIKIDQCFVRSLEEGAGAAAIVQAVVSLGRALGLSVTAEGVETREQHRFLRAAGCAQMQGMLFSGAVPAEDITRALQDAQGFAVRA